MISVDNPLWGAPRIHGELLKLGFEVAQSSVAKYMVKRSGPPSQGWRTFLRNHAPDIAAMDLFVVPTIGFDPIYALVIIRLERRNLVWINVTAHPTAEWIARQITEAFPWAEAPRYLIRDRDRVYGTLVIRCVCLDGNGCLSCLGQLDDKDVRRYLSTEKERAAEAAVYGIPVAALGHAGPSVSPINGVVAALAATEFMVAVTGMRPPNRLLTYHGHLSQVRISADQPQPDCYYCKGIRGTPAAADVERYLKMTHLRERGGTASPKG
jgi:hypothetical protein